MTLGTIHYSAQPSTSDAALITASADTILTGIVASNATGGAATLNLALHHADGRVEPLAAALPIAAGTARQVVDDARATALGGVLVRDGDALHGSASAGSTITLLAFE